MHLKLIKNELTENKLAETKAIEKEIESKKYVSNKDYVIYSYRLANLGNDLIAQKYLNRVNLDYFDTQIYKDLFEALFYWVVMYNKKPDQPIDPSKYAYFLIIKNSLESFSSLQFKAKPSFNRFKSNLNKILEST